MKSPILRLVNKRGIEPLIAAILLIVIAVVGGVLLYLWLTKFQAQTAATAGTSVGSAKVTAAWYQDAGYYSYIYFYVQAPESFNVLRVNCYDAATGELEQSYVDRTNARIYVTHVSDNIYQITVRTTESYDLDEGTFYCEIITDKFGTLVSPVFTGE